MNGPQSSGESAAVLVVDDEPRFLESVSRILHAENYCVSIARGGAEGLQALQRDQFDLLLLDLMMPEIGGERLLRYLKETRLDTAVIVVSATDSVEAATGALLQGAEDFLHKPYSVRDLLMCVRRALKNRRLKQENALMQARIEESEQRHRFVVNNSPDLVFTLDPDGRFTFLNHRFQSLLGLGGRELLGRPFVSAVADADRGRAGEAIADLLENGGEGRTVELNLARVNDSRRDCDPGDHVCFEIKLVSAGDGNGSSAVFGAGRDLTARKLAEDRIRRLAYYDPLTGLPNRQLFSDRMGQALQRARRTGQSLALLFLDLDQFKYINDTLGHSAGDSLLKEAARRFAGLTRKDDSIARMGGDEFTIVLEQLKTAADAGVVAGKVMQVLNRPFIIDGHRIHVGASIGISLYPHDGEDEETLVKHADVAMYRAKQEGRNNYQFYTAEMTQWMLARVELERKLRKAISDRQMVLHYQPQFSLRSGRLTEVEALVRWLDPEEGLIPPDRFLPLAEESGLIVPLGEWVLNQACQQAREWKDKGLPFGRMAVNLSCKQIAGHDFVQDVNEALSNSGLEAEALELEITESVFLEDSAAPIDMLEALRARGVTFAIDDFGTGYSSMSMLKHLCIDKLKIDQAFVRDVPTDLNDKAIVRAILAMAKSLNMGVIAEGVENEAQMQFLKYAGCTDAQGFLFARPLSADDMGRLLSAAAKGTVFRGRSLHPGMPFDA